MRFLIALLMAALAAGASAQGAPNANLAPDALGGDGLVVIALNFTNQVKPGSPATKLGIFVAAKNPEMDVNGRPVRAHYSFTESVNGSRVLVVRRLQAGAYSISTLAGAVRLPVLGVHPLDFNVDAKFEVKPGQVTYLGYLDLVNVPITDMPNQQQSGAPVPLMDGQLSGMASGTMDIKLYDRYAVDVAEMKRAYPAFADTSVVKAVLPAIVSKRPVRSRMEHTLVPLSAD
ncbi:MAG: hypothetical protein HYX47_18440 [Burkholderiales bacterium]|nr:hypothetical protein [Burkholderiales bacterium]